MPNITLLVKTHRIRISCTHYLLVMLLLLEIRYRCTVGLRTKSASQQRPRTVVRIPKSANDEAELRTQINNFTAN